MVVRVVSRADPVPLSGSGQQTEKLMNSKPLGLKQTGNSSNKGEVFRPVAAGKVVFGVVNQRTARGKGKKCKDETGKAK